MTIEWVCKHHSDLGKEQLYAMLQLRSEVFVVEQKCAYPDLDGQDLEGDTYHLMAWEDDQLVAYLRLLDPESQGGDVVIGRVITAPQARGKGLGHEMMEQALKQAEKHLATGADLSVGAGAFAGVLRQVRVCCGG